MWRRLCKRCFVSNWFRVPACRMGCAWAIAVICITCVLKHSLTSHWTSLKLSHSVAKTAWSAARSTHSSTNPNKCVNFSAFLFPLDSTQPHRSRRSTRMGLNLMIKQTVSASLARRASEQNMTNCRDLRVRRKFRVIQQKKRRAGLQGPTRPRTSLTNWVWPFSRLNRLLLRLSASSCHQVSKACGGSTDVTHRYRRSFSSVL